MKYKWPARVVGFAMFGFMLAYVHALYLGISAPVPGALMPHRSFMIIDDQQQAWLANESSRFGIGQYDVWRHRSGDTLEQGRVPSWVLIPAAGTSTISRGFGWPLPALTGAEEYANATRSFVRAPGYHLRNGSTAALTPTRLLAGIVVNSILFGLAAYAIVWAAVKALFMAFARR